MPAGRPTTTGESPIVRFRARGPLAGRLETRRTFPDIRQDPFYGGGRGADAGKPPATGTVAARDLTVFYQLLDAELAQASQELTTGQALMILDAVWGLSPSAPLVDNAPQMLADDIEDAYSDDEDAPSAERKALAAMVGAWPRLRAYAVLEACLAVRDNHGTNTDVPLLVALAAAGLTPKADQK